MSNLILDPIIQKFLDALAKKGDQPLYKLSLEDVHMYPLNKNR